MSDHSPVPGTSASSGKGPSLTDRVLARVNDAATALDLRASASRPKARRRRPAVLDPLAASMTRSPAELRQERSLRRVFLDLGDSYREYRRRTGAPVSEDVRAAANRFRRERNVPALVLVAASLDQLDILTW
jgi:hypothetical protein